MPMSGKMDEAAVPGPASFHLIGGRIACAWILVFCWLIVSAGLLTELEHGAERERTADFCKQLNHITVSENTLGQVAFIQMQESLVGQGLCNSPACFWNEDLQLYQVDESSLVWDFWGALFFAFTSVTTIGYGNFTPMTDGGKLFTIVMSLVGFVLYSFASAPLSELLFDFIKTQEAKLLVKCGRFRMRSTKEGKSTAVTAVISAAVTFIWLLVMAGSYSVVEGWEFSDSLYFSFISGTTIGFGDFSPMSGRDHALSYFAILISLVLTSTFIRVCLELTEPAADADEQIPNSLGEFLTKAPIRVLFLPSLAVSPTIPPSHHPTIPPHHPNQPSNHRTISHRLSG
jgi:potassium channel subfamily K protein 16